MQQHRQEPEREEPEPRALSPVELAHYREHGYVIVRQLFGERELAPLRAGYDHLESLLRDSELPEAFTARDHKPSADGRDAPRVYLHVQPPPGEARAAPGTEAAVTHLRKVQWPSYAHPSFESLRTSAKWPALLAPLLGTTSLKQYINQVNLKKPGGNIAFPFHQDVRDGAVASPLQTYVQTYTMVDAATEENGCLFVLPGSQRRGPLGGDLAALEPELARAVPCTGDAGDVLLFSTYTVHGSQPNRSARQRRAYINGFLRADAARSVDCEWAFRDGAPVALPQHYDYSAVAWRPPPPPQQQQRL
jgi:hypothetical protein